MLLSPVFVGAATNLTCRVKVIVKFHLQGLQASDNSLECC